MPHKCVPALVDVRGVVEKKNPREKFDPEMEREENETVKIYRAISRIADKKSSP